MGVVRKELIQAYREEELFWKQKSRERWLKDGDRNSKFFHAAVKSNRSRRRLLKLKDKNGVEQWSEAAKAEVAVEYFSSLFKSSNPASFDSLFSELVPRVTPLMNDRLVRDISDEEIRVAVFSIKPSSAPGPDGMTGLFFQQFWDTVGPQVSKEVKAFFVEGVFPKEWNLTHLCLLPKVPDPDCMVDLRPISLCSVLYKIISKILVNRLKPLLPSLVSVNQSAFVSERHIADNILIAHETVHALRTHPKIASEMMAVKTDMSKAYDRVEWSYLRALLIALGFNGKWVGWIMFCISSVSFSVLLNDQPFGLFVPQRGLRQGDPLSPFLFILCTEGLSHLLNVAESEGRIDGIQFSVSGPSILHLLFADDSLFICKATKDQSEVLKLILNVYGAATGQIINVDKSSISFGAKVSEDIRLQVKAVLGIGNEGGASKYLGFPECFSGSKVELLAYIKERMKARLSGWHMRKLSQGGKEVLLKAIASALPVFAMSCFKLPKTICDNLASAMADYWWSSDENRRKTHWIAWERMCLPKELGGMGFRDVVAFNQAMLANQTWKFVSSPESLVARFFRSRYFPDSTMLEAQIGARPSYAWRSLICGLELLKKGLKKRVGNGRTTKVWIDRWIEDDEGVRSPWIKNYYFDVNLMACQIIDTNTRRWNNQMLEEIFVPGDVKILKENQPVISREDFWSWKHNKSGQYTVRSGYWLASRELKPEVYCQAEALPSLNGLKEQVWNIKTVPKIKIFIWKALSSAIPVADLILARGMKGDDICQVCGLSGESVNHVLFTCTVARQVWGMAKIPIPENGFHEYSEYVNIQYLLSAGNNKNWPTSVTRIWPWTLWFIWKNRNSFLFEAKRFNAWEVMEKIEEETEQWFVAQVLEQELEQCIEEVELRPGKKWSRPPENWKKCNIGFDWDRKKGLVGAAWVLRDAWGLVQAHSRNAFVGVYNRDEAVLTVVVWAMESMVSLRCANIIFAADCVNLFGAVQRPLAWPSFQYQAQELCERLSSFSEWRLEVESSDLNRGATFIAQSVTKYGLLQSYVASSYPVWLEALFVSESCLSVILD